MRGGGADPAARISSLRARLFALVIVATLPILVVGTVAVTLTLRSHAAAVASRTLEAARGLTLVVDGELRGGLTVLAMLAESPRLAEGGLDVLEARAQVAARHYGGAIALFSADGERLVDTGVRHGLPLPPATPESGVLEAVRTRQPVISNGFRSAADGERHVVCLSWPVTVDGEARYVLSMRIDGDHFAQLLAREAVPAGWVVSLVDGAGAHIARLPHHRESEGRPLVPQLAQKLSSINEAAGLLSTTYEGVPVYSAIARCHRAPWAVAIGGPTRDLDGPLWRAVELLGGGGGATLALALLAALFIARRTARPLEVLASAVQSGSVTTPPLPPAAPREVVRLHRALALAEEVRRAWVDEQALRLREEAARESAEAARRNAERLAAELARLNEQSERAHLAEQEAGRRKDEFLAMLGHELRNPLAPILTAVELMKLRGGASEKERDIIERQARHLIQLVEDLLDVSRIARGLLTLKKATLELGDVIARAVETVSPLFEQRRHHLTVEVAPGLRVLGDATRLLQVIANLLSNAAKYTDPGGEIRLTAVAEEGRARVCVRDNGRGIPPELLPRVFDLFVQGERQADRREGGLGLGLALVKNLVGLHGGEVGVESDAGGTAFTVLLPLAQAPIEVEEPPPPRPSGAARVLIVDDNRDLAETAAALLESAGHEVVIANDGADALVRAREFVPEVALVDIGLPVMDGYELAQKMQALFGARTPRLIAVSGYGQENDRRRSHDAGFVLHLVKPVDAELLLRVVAERA